MSDPYERVNGGRLAFKGGDLATRKSIEKKKKKKQKKNKEKLDGVEDGAKTAPDGSPPPAAAAGDEDIYSIDAAKKKKYDDLFPVEAKKFGYIPKANFESREDALDDRVKKKADRYCK
ncbi:hypothetical protein AtNW77_Chr2g0244991 [Arabidopsis thaliana]|jgi:hypothetical protein|uniref:At2g25720 n=4 Tax=Arabidopsis TaxID=3701 RepID=Q9SL91_ARATH|nr:uncharacterized protein AT2G25720 [Arabidopsis thaliana]KAG7637443.1 hypothetical protein ISN45_At02g019750 [Arabidopsis thaliana x Arabidopsis arenosa]KAG7642053.1 hypothetical protein ISN44_As02g020170 [Arabidopsis suecica]AAD31372.1 expressed protein [Arabidopsis thaliana]AAM63280.1 unknown [Arabidopsis thaliana]ABD38909.1 At2g25720 [Arabidopsis thaliana]|eukprot:NP_565606.1 hypothetical protein AT2G25720 [Arabidopsis thaliana]